MANLSHFTGMTAVDSNGDVISGAKLNFYEVGGPTTEKDTYQEKTLVTANTNPVLANSSGVFPVIWLNGSYYVEYTDASDNTIKTIDNYNGGFADLETAVNASNAALFAFDEAASSEVGGAGLTFGWQAGRVDNANGTVTNVAADTLTLTDNTTNYIYLDYADNTVKKSTSSPGSNTALLFTVATSAGGITSVTEKLTPYRTPSSRQFPPEHLSGLTISADPGDTAHDVLIAVGTARDAGDNQDISLTTVITKQLDASWAEGDDAGGFPTGISLTGDTRYRVFVIVKTDGTVDAGFDTVANASNLLADASDYSYYRQVGWFHVDGSSDISGIESISHPGSSRVLLDVIEANAQATVDFTDDIDSTYSRYEVEFENVIPATNAVDLYYRTGNDSVFDSGASDYDFTSFRHYSAGATNNGASTAIESVGSSLIANTRGGVSGTVIVHDPSNASSFTHFRHEGTHGHSTSGSAGFNGSGFRAEAAAHDRLQFLFSSGNITSGQFKLYGIK